MKVCLILQRNFAYIGHAIALALKEKYGLTDFCAYVYLRDGYDFLRTQKDIAYTNLLLDEDVHGTYKNEKLDMDYLRMLEKEYGLPNLWPYITLDRIVRFNQLLREYPYNTPRYTHEEMLRILQVKAKAVLAFLDTEKPDVLFLYPMGSISQLLLYTIAKKRGIRTILIMPLGMKNVHVFSEDYRCFSFVEKRLKAPRGSESDPFRKKARAYLEEFRTSPKGYYPMSHPTKQPIHRGKQFKFLLPKNLVASLSFLCKYLYASVTKRDRHDYSTIRPIDWFKDRVRRKLRGLIGASDLYEPVDPSDTFAFYPLHTEPEINLLLQAPFMDDQVYLIDKIARALPVGWKLYVKEHPLMANYRPRAYYKELKKIPNVKLVNPAIPSFELLQKAQLITTVAGAGGFEGACFKKPVITFGDIYYNALSSVKNCKTLEDLASLVKKHLAEFRHNEDELVDFISAIYEDSAEADLYHLWEVEQDFEVRKKGVVPLADLLAKKLGL